MATRCHIQTDPSVRDAIYGAVCAVVDARRENRNALARERYGVEIARQDAIRRDTFGNDLERLLWSTEGRKRAAVAVGALRAYGAEDAPIHAWGILRPFLREIALRAMPLAFP